MAEGVGVSKYDVGSTVYVPYEGGTHYQARVRFHVEHAVRRATTGDHPTCSRSNFQHLVVLIYLNSTRAYWLSLQQVC